MVVGGAADHNNAEDGRGKTQSQQHPVRSAEEFFYGSQHSRLLSGE